MLHWSKSKLIYGKGTTSSNWYPSFTTNYRLHVSGKWFSTRGSQVVTQMMTHVHLKMFFKFASLKVLWLNNVKNENVTQRLSLDVPFARKEFVSIIFSCNTTFTKKSEWIGKIQSSRSASFPPWYYWWIFRQWKSMKSCSRRGKTRFLQFVRLALSSRSIKNSKWKKKFFSSGKPVFQKTGPLEAYKQNSWSYSESALSITYVSLCFVLNGIWQLHRFPREMDFQKYELIRKMKKFQFFFFIFLHKSF